MCAPWSPPWETRPRPRCCPAGCWTGPPCRPAGRPGPRGTGRCCCSPSPPCWNQGPTITWSSRLGLVRSEPSASPADWSPTGGEPEPPFVFEPVRGLVLFCFSVRNSIRMRGDQLNDNNNYTTHTTQHNTTRILDLPAGTSVSVLGRNHAPFRLLLPAASGSTRKQQNYTLNTYCDILYCEQRNRDVPPSN